MRSRALSVASRKPSAGMSAYSVWPYFIGMAFLVAVAALPIFVPADTPPNPKAARITALDGLRGFLALAVFFHHAAINRQYLVDGIWALPPSRLYTLLGQVSVAMFFMITGFLFWSRLIKERSTTNWLRLYIGRIFRLVPLYLATAIAGLLIVLVSSKFELAVPFTQFACELLGWFSMGFAGPVAVNNFEQAPLLLSGLTWTLRYEWFFYLSLPLLALIAGRTWHMPFAVISLAISLLYLFFYGGPAITAPPSECIALFLVGMTSASLIQAGLVSKPSDALASLLVAILLCVVFLGFTSSHSAGATLLLGVAFYLLASGCSFFGLLTSRPARRLGDVSYGIYLLQGLAIFLVLDSVRVDAFRSPSVYWAAVLVCAVVLVAAATVAHAWIERPGIELGKRLGMGVAGKS
jgi:peptidoglycan/LPS O-acetylase OafA/YrhL